MATMLAHLIIKPGQEAEYERLQAWLYEQTHARETHIRRYEFYRGQQPGEYYGLLSFTNFHEFLEHQTSEHHESFTQQFRKLVESGDFQWVDPVAGACDHTPTDPQPTPDGASELARGYAESMAVDVPDWWRSQRSERAAKA